MSRMAELAYDIEQLYIEGRHPRAIATELNCPLEIVYAWIEENSLDAGEETYDYYGA